MYYIIWKYTVDPSRQTKFEEEYSRTGSWFKLFEPCDEYMGHELVKNTADESYILIDKWMSKADHERFIQSHQLEYDDLNRRSKELYDAEESIGTFNTLH